MIIKLSTGDGSQPGLLARQTPGNTLKWADHTFVIDQEAEHYDWWVILHSSSIAAPQELNCDPSHVVFVSMEPPEWKLPAEFYAQFSHVVTCDRGVQHPKVIRRNGLTWWAGLQVAFKGGHEISSTYAHDYDSFKALEYPAKNNRISVITSRKNFFPGHKRRLEFLEKLQTHPIAEFIDFYGGWHNPIGDKLDALLGYKYHIALENSSTDDYWTEKFADPLLAWTLPLYSGCPNISQYFPEGSYISLDIDDFDTTVRLLEQVIANDVHGQHITAIQAAREKVLDDYNLFQLLVEICNEPAKTIARCKINPASHFAERAATTVPSLSIFIPSNRPLESAWPSILSGLETAKVTGAEVVVSDNSGDAQKQEKLKDISDSEAVSLRYILSPGATEIANWRTAIENTRGNFVAALADDDFLHVLDPNSFKLPPLPDDVVGIKPQIVLWTPNVGITQVNNFPLNGPTALERVQQYSQGARGNNTTLFSFVQRDLVLSLHRLFRDWHPTQGNYLDWASVYAYVSSGRYVVNPNLQYVYVNHHWSGPTDLIEQRIVAQYTKVGLPPEAARFALLLQGLDAFILIARRESPVPVRERLEAAIWVLHLHRELFLQQYRASPSPWPPELEILVRRIAASGDTESLLNGMMRVLGEFGSELAHNYARFYQAVIGEPWGVVSDTPQASNIGPAGLRSPIEPDLAPQPSPPVNTTRFILEDFLQIFKSHLVAVDLVRIGGESDGGYLVPDILDSISHCFSPGVSDTADFEHHLSLSHGIKSFLADASVAGPPIADENFSFVKKFLGSRTENDFITLSDWMNDELQGGEKGLILQMDIEGGEYDVLTTENDETLRRFSIMVIEFHSLHLMADLKFSKMFTAVFEKIFQSFLICHVHPNNCCGVASISGIEVPRVIEVTFLRNDLAEILRKKTKIQLPHELDRKNIPTNEDLILPAIWWRP